METKSWKDIKDNVYGTVGTERPDELERDLNLLRSDCFLKKPVKKNN